MNKIDIGCGIQKKPGFIGIDKLEDSQADFVLNFTKQKLPFEDNSIEEIFCGDVIEHITYIEMIFLMNEIWRVCKNGSKIIINTVDGINGWLSHPPHIRPILENQFNYFTQEAIDNATFNNMRKADGIKAIFEKIDIKNIKGNLTFELKVIKK